MSMLAATRPASVALLLTIAVLMAGACRGRSDEASFADRLMAARAAKDERFGTASDSPVPVERRAEILPLSYYPPDEAYSVPASLDAVDSALNPAVDMPTSTGQHRPMRRVGVLRFTLRGVPLRLGAFKEADGSSQGRLFVPFTDATSGTDTYEAGRYLDLDVTPTGIYVIDFNRAYNPYCCYNPKYDCPYPPAENRLSVAIQAGERVKPGVSH